MIFKEITHTNFDGVDWVELYLWRHGQLIYKRWINKNYGGVLYNYCGE